MDHYMNLLKLRMGRYPTVDVEVPIGVLFEACDYYYKKNDAIALIAGSTVNASANVDESNAIYISDLRDEGDSFSMLLVRGDPGRAMPSFVNPKKRTVTTIKSNEPGDVPGASSHLIVSKQEIAAGPDQGRYRTAMERTRGIGRALARDFLTSLLGRFSEEFPDRFTAEKKRKSKKEKPETVQYRPTVRFNPHENASLKNDLESGRIGGFKLVRGKTDFQGEANEPKIERMDVQLRAVIAPTEDVNRVSKLINHVRKALDAISFEDFKLELVDEGGDTIGSTQMLSVDNLGDGDMRYCKTVAINGLGAGVVECYDKFYDPILQFGKKVIHAEKNWQ
ncbi:hypothetical protein [Mesorhizobium sp. B2-3-5]|uniref:hypothetical protein n=1 Tax=Mesorhizobium sp. B2-3-5 TaxID=2589958 RepID=UPI00112B951B|nr:hypothetical protein [Mesorhizobium sp. B2-3-5]TPM34472.1 hypothetical protein FJ958_08930 [Mesorhizobium sp. B2-3-5]